MATTLYALVHPETGDVRYIGKTTQLKARLRRHMSDAKRGQQNHRCCWIRSLPARPLIVPIITTEERYAMAAERFAIALYRSAGDDLTNATDGGEGAPGSIRTPAQRAAIGARFRGKKLSLEHRHAISSGKTGGVRSPETRAKISAAQRGRARGPYSAERCAAISAGRRGKGCGPRPVEHRAAISAGQRGKKHSPAWCAAISAGKRRASPQARSAVNARISASLRAAWARRREAVQ